MKYKNILCRSTSTFSTYFFLVCDSDHKYINMWHTYCVCITYLQGNWIK